jgi:hypothetical protein
MPLDSTKRQESSESSNNQLVEFWTSPNQLGCPFFLTSDQPGLSEYLKIQPDGDKFTHKLDGESLFQ